VFGGSGGRRRRRRGDVAGIALPVAPGRACLVGGDEDVQELGATDAVDDLDAVASFHSARVVAGSASPAETHLRSRLARIARLRGEHAR
jgi:hypothetical protein